MTRRENSLFEQKIITSPDSANAQTFPSLSSCPAGTQLSCTGSNKVISFRSTVSRVILLCITQSQGLHPEHVSMRRRRWCCPFLLTLSYRHCSGGSLCHQEVPGKMQAPSSSAASAPSSISQGLHRKGGDVPQLPR